MKKNGKTKKLSFRLPEKMHNYLMDVQNETGMDISDILRSIIMDYIEIKKQSNQTTS